MFFEDENLYLLFKEIAEKKGGGRQLQKTVEELGELTAAISRYIASSAQKNRTAFFEELCDCAVMINQLFIIYEGDELKGVCTEKIARIRKRLKEGEL